LAKYCTHCGHENEDIALFCISCGEKFPEQEVTAAAGQGEASTPSTPSTPSSTVYRFSLQKGDHKFMLGEVDFVAADGATAYSATRESVLHENYTLLKNDVKQAFMKHMLAMGGFSFEVQDASGQPMGVLRCKTDSARHQLPSYWFEDTQGNTIATLAWEQGTMRFAISNLEMTQVYAEGLLELPGGVKGDLKAMLHKVYTLSIQQSSPLPSVVVLAFCVAIANISI